MFISSTNYNFNVNAYYSLESVYNFLKDGDISKDRNEENLNISVIFDNFIDMNNDISIYQLNNMTNNKFSINIYTNEALGSTAPSVIDIESQPQAVQGIPQFEEVFEVIASVFESDPMNGAFDVKVDETSLKSVSLALCQGMSEYLGKIKSNPSDQDKALAQLGKYLEKMNVYPVGYTQWSHSESQGIAARVMFNGRSRTALIGPIHAMARATTKFPPKVSELVESASASGHSAYVLGIDGLAYGAFEVTHALRQIN